MKEIVAQFSQSTSQALRNGDTNLNTTEVLQAVRDAGASIEPLHANSDNPGLNRYFVIRLADDGPAEDLALRLRSLEPTEAAYIKPLGETP